MSGFQTNLLTGLAVALQTVGLGTWNAKGVYMVTQTGIVLRTVPQKPDRCITLSTYGVSDSPALSDSVIGLQVRCRWGGPDSTLVDDFDDSIYNFLHGKRDWTLSTGVRIVQCLRQSQTSLGQDGNSRWMTSSNYYCTTYRPSTNRI